MTAKPKPRSGFNWLLLLTHLGAWAPLANLAREFFSGKLIVNPIQDLTFGTGFPAFILLVLTLAVTPVVTLTGWRQLIPLRRWLGLYSFFYATLHVSIFIFDNNIDPQLIWDTIIEKRYVLAGLGAFLIMLPLALTSTKGWQRRLGRDWKFLHRGVYFAGLLAVLHFVWLVKSDIREPLTYGAIVALLLILRLPAVRQKAARARESLRRMITGKPRLAQPVSQPVNNRAPEHVEENV